MAEGVAGVLEQVEKLSDEEKGEVVVGAVEKMSVLGLSKLVKELEEKFGVTASAPAMAMPMGMMGGMGGAAEEKEEKTSFDVVLKEIGGQKIQVIKVVRAHTSLGLKEAKDLVEKAPTTVKEGLSKEDSEKLKKELEDAGATVELK